MENQLEKSMENDMETRVIWVVYIYIHIYIYMYA